MRLSRPAPAGEPQRRQLPALDRPAIAVLPFANLSGEPEQEYFSEGISEDIITALSKLRWFYVDRPQFLVHLQGQVGAPTSRSARSSASAMSSRAACARMATMSASPPSSIDVVTGSHLWAERYDRDLADVFAVQDEITQAVVAAIEPQLYAAEDFRARRKTPDNMDAWDLVMRALSHYWRVTRQDNLVAQALLEKAIAVDPDYGQALGLLAACHTFCGPYGLGGDAQGRSGRGARGAGGDPRRQRGRVGALCARQRLSVHSAASTIASPNSSWRCGSIRISRRRAASMAWRCPIAGAGRKATAPRARRCDSHPRDPFAAIYCGVAAYCQYVGRNYAEAIRLSREALRQRSDFVGAHRVLTASLGMAGDADAAKAALRGPAPRPAQHLARLARERTAVRARGGQGALSGGVSAGGGLQ